MNGTFELAESPETGNVYCDIGGVIHLYSINGERQNPLPGEPLGVFSQDMHEFFKRWGFKVRRIEL